MAVEKYSNNSRWLTDEIFQLIDIVRQCESLYNPQHKNYFCRPFVENLWKEIDRKLGRCPGASLAKWTNLRICFRREYSTFLKDKIKTPWTYFDKMFFLHPFLRRKRTSTEGIEMHIQEALEQISSITRGNFKNYVENIEPCEAEQPESHEEEVEEEGIWDDNVMIKEEHEHDQTDQCFDLDTVDSDDIEIVSIESNHISDLSQHKGKEMSTDTAENRYQLKRQIDETNEFLTPGSSVQQRTSPATTIKRVKLEDQEENNSTHELLLNSTDDTEAIDLSESSNHHLAAHSSKSSSIPENQNDLSMKSQAQVICECKTNPDAMFLLSLLPDIQSLSRRDKGKFKIEVQRIIQNFLYPDDS